MSLKRFVLPHLYFLSLFILLGSSPLLSLDGKAQAKPLIDFERDMLDDFVLETKRVIIPGYPDAFNASMIRWNKSLLMSFRTGGYQAASGPEEYLSTVLMAFRTRDPINGSTNGIGLILLNDSFEPISEPQILEIPHSNPSFMYRQQDPRLVEVGNKVYIVYSNMIDGKTIPEIRRMFVVELRYDGRRFYTTEPDALVEFEGQIEQRWQKNWVPFDYKGNLLLAYSINPHRILRPLLGTGSCASVSSTRGDIQWKWGDLRGGTQAVLQENGEYLSIFHSSIDMPTEHSFGKKITHYFMGAYTFQAEPPFSITRISPKPIVGKDFYYGEIYHAQTWKPLRCVFPCGMITNKKYVWISYGRQDHEIWVAKLDKKKLMDSLAPVTAKEVVLNSPE